MKIKISKNYEWLKSTYEYDRERLRQGDDFTMLSGYAPEWKEIEVTQEILLDYIHKGYAIKINC